MLAECTAVGRLQTHNRPAQIAKEGDDLAHRVGAVAGEYAADIDDVVDISDG